MPMSDETLIDLLNDKVALATYPVDVLELAKQVQALFNEWNIPLELDQAIVLTCKAFEVIEYYARQD